MHNYLRLIIILIFYTPYINLYICYEKTNKQTRFVILLLLDETWHYTTYVHSIPNLYSHIRTDSIKKLTMILMVKVLCNRVLITSFTQQVHLSSDLSMVDYWNLAVIPLPLDAFSDPCWSTVSRLFLFCRWVFQLRPV